MTFKFDRVMRLSMFMFVQNFIELSAAPYQLSY